MMFNLTVSPKRSRAGSLVTTSAVLVIGPL
jgi:hypothetical protein